MVTLILFWRNCFGARSKISDAWFVLSVQTLTLLKISQKTSATIGNMLVLQASCMVMPAFEENIWNGSVEKSKLIDLRPKVITVDLSILCIGLLSDFFLSKEKFTLIKVAVLKS